MTRALPLLLALTGCAAGWQHVDLNPDVVDVNAQGRAVHEAARTALSTAIESCARDVLTASPVTDPAMAYVLCADEMQRGPP